MPIVVVDTGQQARLSYVFLDLTKTSCSKRHYEPVARDVYPLNRYATKSFVLFAKR